MLLNFSVSNLGSFNEKVTFSLFPGKISKQHKNHILEDIPFKALKGAAIYGANASGKSNSEIAKSLHISESSVAKLLKKK